MRLLIALLAVMAAPSAVLAQTWPGWPGPPPAGYSPGAAIADQHRQEMERLRGQAAEREALARLQRLETQAAVRRLQAERQPTPPLPPSTAYVRSPEQERAGREATAARRQQSDRAVGEIDAWLDRRPD